MKHYASPLRSFLIASFIFAFSACAPRVDLSAPLDCPSQQDLVTISKNIAGLTYKNSGATYNLYDGSLAGKNSFAVALFPDREQEVEGFPGAGSIHAFIQRNTDLLCRRDRHVGTWVNQALGRTYLEISTSVPALKEAKELGKQHNQFSVFDLKNGQEVPIDW